MRGSIYVGGWDSIDRRAAEHSLATLLKALNLDIQDQVEQGGINGAGRRDVAGAYLRFKSVQARDRVLAQLQALPPGTVNGHLSAECTFGPALPPWRRWKGKALRMAALRLSTRYPGLGQLEVEPAQMSITSSTRDKLVVLSPTGKVLSTAIPSKISSADVETIERICTECIEDTWQALARDASTTTG